MSKQPYSELARNALRDPLWWVGLGAAVALVVSYFVEAPYWLISAFWCLFGLTFVASAIRGKDVQRNRPMTRAERIVSAVVGIVIVAFAVANIVMGV